MRRLLTFSMLAALLALVGYSYVFADTAGYTTQGASEQAIAVNSLSNSAGLKITLPSEGTISSASIYGRRTLADKIARVRIYSDVAGARGSLLHTTNNTTINASGAALYNMTFASPPTLSAATYWLEVEIDAEGADTGSGFLNYDTGGAANSSYTLSDLGVPNYSTLQYSVWITYTASNPTVASSVALRSGNIQLRTGDMQIR